MKVSDEKAAPSFVPCKQHSQLHIWVDTCSVMSLSSSYKLDISHTTCNQFLIPVFSFMFLHQLFLYQRQLEQASTVPQTQDNSVEHSS